ncbi:hypothetical protein CC80DRAFT_496807 [Byssothecium circinans]|uniref:Uncharacterized protein n=1 Tax=Byssothecium circinans TaxID=147558 RepID=A0A6A5TE42_9PLEO|nr:hypothetical protein CC80DRAFT_496807 [Byssothecium circinans]
MPPALSPPDYLAELAALDLSDISAIAKFLFETTQAITSPVAVPLGSHGSVEFFLEPTDYGIEVTNTALSPLQKMRGTVSPTICAYEAEVHQGKFAFPGVPTGLKYGVGLGKLSHFNPATSTYKSSSEAAAADDLEYSGLLVLLNTVDHSLWIAADWYPVSIDTGDRIPMLANSKVYGMVPGDKKLQVGVTRVSLNGWESGFVAGNPITGPDLFGTFPLLGCKLIAKPALEEEFLAERQKFLAAHGSAAAAT